MFTVRLLSIVHSRVRQMSSPEFSGGMVSAFPGTKKISVPIKAEDFPILRLHAVEFVQLHSALRGEVAAYAQERPAHAHERFPGCAAAHRTRRAQVYIAVDGDEFPRRVVSIEL